MIIRPAVREERGALEALQLRASLVWESDREWVLAHAELIRLPEDQILGGHVLVAERDGVPLGFAVVVPRGDGDAELDGLFVDPESWRMGIGRALVVAAEALARERGSTVLHVVGNPNAAGFYSSCGFKTVGTQQTQHRPALTLKKALV